MFEAVDDATLRAWNASAIGAMAQLQTGGMVTSASYTQGDGTKSVTRTPASIATLKAWISSLANEMIARGLMTLPRRPARRAIGLRY